MLFKKWVRISVGTDLSRPPGVWIADQDVINRSLQISVLIYLRTVKTPVINLLD